MNPPDVVTAAVCSDGAMLDSAETEGAMLGDHVVGESVGEFVMSHVNPAALEYVPAPQTKQADDEES